MVALEARVAATDGEGSTAAFVARQSTLIKEAAVSIAELEVSAVL